MPSIVFLAAVLSLDVTRQLVSSGAGLGYDIDAAEATGTGRFTGVARPSTGLPYPSLAIVGCTGNAVSPIIITTQFPHGVSARGIGGMACIVSGVGGNTAANNVATDPRDRTVGLNQGVLAVPLTPTTLALYGQDSTGRIVAITGNGNYTSGGTVTPALGDGQILIGMGGVKENGAPPRIVMVPRSITPGPRSPSTTGVRLSEFAAQRSQRNTSTDKIACDFHCWGQRLPVPDAAYDFDAALAITQALKDSSYLLFGATREVGPGTWNDQTVRSVSALKDGELITFSIAMSVPVLDNALPFVPSGTTFESVIQSPTPEIAATIDVIVN